METYSKRGASQGRRVNTSIGTLDFSVQFNVGH